MPEILDKVLVCVDGNEEFVWTAGEQAFYLKVGNRPPKRCPKHRAEAKAKRMQSQPQGYDNR